MSLAAASPHGHPPRRVSRRVLGPLLGMNLGARGLLHLLEELAGDDGVVRDLQVEEIAGMAGVTGRMTYKHLATLDLVGLTRREQVGRAVAITVVPLAGA